MEAPEDDAAKSGCSGFRCGCRTTTCCQYIHTPHTRPMAPPPLTPPPPPNLPHTVILSDLSRVRQSPPPLSLKTSLLSPMPCMSGRCRAVCDAHKPHTHTQTLNIYWPSSCDCASPLPLRCTHQTATRHATETYEVGAVDCC